MKNILVTGCNGQLGNEMQLLAAGHPEFNYFFTDVKELDITDEKAVKSFVGMHGRRQSGKRRSVLRLAEPYSPGLSGQGRA